MKNWSAGLLGLQHFLILLLLSFATSARVHAAISEFIPVVQPNDYTFDGFPYSLLAPYGPGGIGYIQVRDGNGGTFTWDGLDGSRFLNFNVTGINTPITRVEIILAIAHPHINDLSVELQSPSGRKVTLFSRLSRSDIAIRPRPGFNFAYFGSIGGSFNAGPFTGMAPISIVSEVDPDDEQGSLIKQINDVTALDQTGTSNTFMNTLPAGTYYSQGDLRLFNGLSGTASATNATPANGRWTIKIVDGNQNNFIGSDYQLYNQGVTAAQIIITQEGGYKVWTGAVSNSWNDAGNWDPTYGRPSYFQINSIIFPANAQRFAPINDLVEVGAPARMRIAEISLNGPTPYTVSLGTPINQNRATFYKRSHITNYGGSHTLTINTNADSQPGRLKLDAISGPLTINGNINGGIGLKKIGQDTVILNNFSGYTGNTIVQEGTLEINNENALGANGAAAYTLLRNTGQLRVGVPGTIAEPLWLESTGKTHKALHITQNVLWSGLMKFIPIPGYNYASALQVDLGDRLIVRNFDTTTPDFYHWLINGGGTVELAQLLPLPTTTGLLPTGTMLQVNGSTFQFNIAQNNNIGNIILENGIITGAGALTPRSLGTFAIGGGMVASSGTSNIANNMAFTVAEDNSLNVTGGTLTMGGVLTGSVSKRGGGTAELNGISATLPVTVDVGVLGGTGSVGAVSVARQGVINPGRGAVGGTFTTTTTTFANQSALIIDANLDQLNGAVSLNGVAGVGGPILQVYDTVTDNTKIIILGASTGTFDAMPNPSAGITYNVGDVRLAVAAETGRTVWFDPSSYVITEAAGTLTVTALWTGGAGSAKLRNYGGTARRGRDFSFNESLGTSSAVNTVQYTIPILQNYIDSGDTSTTLALVPLNGARIRSAPPAPGGPVASLSILDDDNIDAAPCGFGTGLTVFFLLGFGFLWQLRLRSSKR